MSQLPLWAIEKIIENIETQPDTPEQHRAHNSRHRVTLIATDQIMESRKGWAAKYKELRAKNQLLLQEVIRSSNDGSFIHTNEIAYDVDYYRGSAVFCTGVRRGEKAAGHMAGDDGFADDVIVILNKSKVLFIRLDGSCSVEEIERAFVQICYYTERDMMWYILRPPTVFVHWFRPMDYETGAFLYTGRRVEQRVRVIQRLLKKWLNASGQCRVEVHNVFPRKEKWQPATLSIEVWNYQDLRRRLVVRDALGEVEFT